MNVYETMLMVVSIAFICFCIAGVVITILQIAFEMRHEAKATHMPPATPPASPAPQTPPAAPRVPAAPQIISTTREVVDED